MSVLSAIRAGQRAAERLMTSTVEVYSEKQELVAGVYEPTETVVYEGPGKIQCSSSVATARNPIAGEHTFVVDSSPALHLPADTTGITTGLLVRVTEDDIAPLLIGRVWRITSVSAKSHQTALRVPIEEVIS